MPNASLDALPVSSIEAATLLCFGPFQLDLISGELLRGDEAVPLRPQHARLLAYLVRHPGALITRDDLRSALWGEGTFVDVDSGLDFSFSRLRSALGDDPRNPRYIETLRGRGYRFIAPVRALAATSAFSHQAVDFRALVDGLGDVVALLDIEGTMLFVNGALTEATGWWPADLVGKSSFDAVHPDDRALARAALRQAVLQPGNRVLARFRVIHQNGRTHLKECRLTGRLNDPGVAAVVLVFRDLCERD
jgi:PAS domain S-box-containing protein